MIGKKINCLVNSVERATGYEEGCEQRDASGTWSEKGTAFVDRPQRLWFLIITRPQA